MNSDRFQIEGLECLRRPDCHLSPRQQAESEAIAPVVNSARRVASLLRHRSLDLFAVEGSWNGDTFRILVANDGSTLDYIRNLAFPETSTLTEEGSISAAAASRLCEADANLVVVGANQLLTSLYAGRGFFLIPKWVTLFLHVWDRPEVMFCEADRLTRKYFRRLCRSVTEAGFTCQVSTDPQWLDRFYYDMYKPYALHKHGALAVVHSYLKIKRAFDKGALLLVNKEDEPVAGAVIHPQGEIMCIPHMGMMAGDVDAAREGASMAIDYYAVTASHCLGYHSMNYGHARPFLTDGVLRYKLNWKMEVREDEDGTGFFAVAAPRQNPRGIKFLAENPFYNITPTGLALHKGP